MVGDKPLPIDFSKVSYIEEQIGYWRKANAIHKWFVDNVQGDKDDCGDYEVNAKQLQQLLDIVNRTLKSSELVDGKIKNGQHGTPNGGWEDNIEDGKIIRDSTVAQELLPSSSGFFFGSTEYDEYYYENLVTTKEILETALVNNSDDCEFYYHSSW